MKAIGRKGQLSFDLFFAVIVVAIVAQVFTAYTLDIAGSQQVISIKSQEKQIAMDLKALLESTKALSDGTYSIEYTPEKIHAIGTKNRINCTIDIAGSPPTITVSAPEEFGGTSTAVELTALPAGTTFSPTLPAPCSQKLTISKP
ncbi:MAG: hypothetical protein V1494_02525 [Candidatus Diapherotrites archaeon]